MALQLNVKLLTGEQHSVVSSASRTVWELKVQVGRQTGVPPYQQKLSCQSGARPALQDGAQLSQYGLRAGDTLLLLVKAEEPMPVLLKNPSSRTSTYSVLPSDPVERFRARVREQEPVQESQFWLTYEGQTLEDGRKLSDYNVAPLGTISLNLRLRGGGALPLNGWLLLGV